MNFVVENSNKLPKNELQGKMSLVCSHLGTTHVTLAIHEGR
jgi:hypothetical protein